LRSLPTQADQSISSYSVERSGVITLRAEKGGDAGPGSAPQDLGVEPHGEYLYLLDRGNAGIARFDASEPTELKYLDLVGELAPFASGIAVY
jgi:DNA-binding beta-propeller fold protein YncE